MGSVLYLLYTSPLAAVIRSHGLDYHMYADENQLYLSFKTQDADLAKFKIEESVTSICKWTLTSSKSTAIKLRLWCFTRSSVYLQLFKLYVLVEKIFVMMEIKLTVIFDYNPFSSSISMNVIIIQYSHFIERLSVNDVSVTFCQLSSSERLFSDI